MPPLGWVQTSVLGLVFLRDCFCALRPVEQARVGSFTQRQPGQARPGGCAW